MRFLQLIFLSLFSFMPLFASFPSEIKAKILFLMHRGESEKALSYYLDYAKESQSEDFELLAKAASALLENGISSEDPETRLLSLYGAGISLNKEALSILDKGLSSDDIRLQLVSLSFLEKFHDDEASLLIHKALNSSSLLPRLEAAYILAKAGSPDIVDHLLSLYEKIPAKAKPLIAEIVSKCEGENATLMLKRLLNDPVAEVRLAAILEVAETEREDLSPNIKAMACMGNFREEECAAYVLGKLKDSSAKEKLLLLSERKSQTTRLSALRALSELSVSGASDKILQEDSPFAIALWAKDPKSLSLLEEKLASDDFSIRINAAYALLQMGKKPPIELLRHMLISDESDLGFLREFSPGTTLYYWKAIPNKTGQQSRYARLMQETLRFKQNVLKEALKLPEDDFLKIIKMIFEEKDYTLYLPAAEHLINNQSDKALELLKEMTEKAGAPYARLIANLALFEITKESVYEKALIDWLLKTYEQPLIRFKKEEIPSSFHSPYLLTPEETSEILIITFETLASSRNSACIEALIKAIASGNQKNRYALAGLLIKATE